MSYTALYRKFRPDNFGDVKGQDHIVTTLRNQLKAQRTSHAYLFTGTRGTGKTSVAKIFARAVNCENPNENGPCGECPTCQSIARGSSLNVIEIDAASNNGVDNIREIVEEVSYRPTEGKYKVYIIDEVHMLSTGAFNALLKTLEEPPEYVIFILATTEVHKLPITVLSRCQRYDFKRITVDSLAARMRELIDIEGTQVEERAIQYIARAADGSMRDALSLLDQCIAFNFGEVLTYDKALDVLGAVDTSVFSKLLRCLIDRNVAGCIEVIDEVIMQGRELTQFVNDLTWYLRNLMLVQTSDDMEDVIDMSTENLAKLKEEAELVDRNQVIRLIHVFSELSGQLRYANQKRVLTEVALIRLCKPQMQRNDEAMLDRIRSMEEKLENGDFIVRASGAEASIGNPEVKHTEAAVRKQLPKALPEDVARIVQQWGMVMSNLDVTVASDLQNAVLSLDNNSKLDIVLPSGDIGAAIIHDEAKLEQLSGVMADMIGKTIEFNIHESNNAEDYDLGVIDLRQIQFEDIEIITEEEE